MCALLRSEPVSRAQFAAASTGLRCVPRLPLELAAIDVDEILRAIADALDLEEHDGFLRELGEARRDALHLAVSRGQRGDENVREAAESLIRIQEDCPVFSLAFTSRQLAHLEL